MISAHTHSRPGTASDRRRAAEAGVTLIEVVVAAVVLFIASGAVLTLFVGAARTSVSNRDRVTASNLAERDQERLRATPFDTLATLTTASPTPVPATVGGVTYDVQSTVRWVNDGAGFQPTCTSGPDGTSDYLQITSLVTPRSGGRSGPQSISSLLSPKVTTVGSKGTLSVPFVDRAGRPLQGVPTTLSNASNSGSTTSNASGCAVFTYFPSGTYTATFSRDGYVTDGGSTSPQKVSATITTGRTNFTDTQQLDRAATVKVAVVTRLTTATTQSAGNVPVVTVANPKLDNGSGSVQASSSARASAFTIGGLFPFADGYSAYAGDCSANDPTKYGVAATPATTDPGATTPVTVFAPTMIARTVGYTFKHLVITATDPGCKLKYDLTFSPTSSVVVQVPFGTYTVCGDDGSYKVSRSGVRMASTTPNDMNYSASEAQGGTCS